MQISAVMTAEQKIVQAALQEATIVEVGGKTYEVAPPFIATIMKISALISTMPQVDMKSEDYIGEMLRIAKDCGVIGDIIATIILGAKRIRDFKPGIFGSRRTEMQELSEALLYEKTPKELEAMLGGMIANGMDMVFFSKIGISLSEINLVKPTKS